MKERGITLIALIISIIIMIILASITIKIVYDTKMIETAVNGAKEYSEAAIKEQEEMDDLSNFLDVAKNRRPYLNVNIREIGETFCIIEAKAKDEDGGKLTYKYTEKIVSSLNTRWT